MQLQFDEIKRLTRGAIGFSEQDGRLMPRRFTEEQTAAYAERNEGHWKKTFASAGIRLELRTDSTVFGMKAELRAASSRRFADFDVCVNGAILTTARFVLAEETLEISFSVALPEGLKELSVYLPWTVSTAIGEVTLSDGAVAEPIEKKLRMICFGDSITHGYDAHNPSFSYASRLVDALGAEGINKGIGGEVFFPSLAELRDPIEPELITVAYGTNDWSKSAREVFEQNARAFYERLSAAYPTARIFAISPVWRKNLEATDKSVGPFPRVHEYLAEVTASLPNVTLIDGRTLVPHERRLFPGDGLHPSDEGFRHYANNLYAAIRKYI